METPLVGVVPTLVVFIDLVLPVSFSGCDIVSSFQVSVRFLGLFGGRKGQVGQDSFILISCHLHTLTNPIAENKET